jgi:hypothetical protein
MRNLDVAAMIAAAVLVLLVWFEARRQLNLRRYRVARDRERWQRILTEREAAPSRSVSVRRSHLVSAQVTSPPGSAQPLSVRDVTGTRLVPPTPSIDPAAGTLFVQRAAIKEAR